MSGSSGQQQLHTASQPISITKSGATSHWWEKLRYSVPNNMSGPTFSTNFQGDSSPISGSPIQEDSESKKNNKDFDGWDWGGFKKKEAFLMYQASGCSW